MKKNERLIISGNVSSNLGDVLYNFGLNWWIVSTTGNSQLLGLIISISTIPIIFTNLISGVISDNFNKKKIIVSMDFLTFLACFLLAIYSDPNEINIVMVIIFNSLIGIFYSIFSPAARSIVPILISSENIKKVNSRISSLNESIKIIAPMLGGFLIALPNFNIKYYFAIIGITFLISAILEIFISNTPTGEKVNKNYLKEFFEGYKYIYSKKNIFFLLITASLINCFIAGYNVLLPNIATELSNKSINYSFIISAEAIGAIIGALSLNFSNKSTVHLNTIQKELFFCGIPLILGFAFYNLFIIIIISFAFGLFLTRFNVQFFTYIQLNVEEYILGRVFSFIFTISIVFMPIGSALFGYLSIFPISTLLLVLSIGILVSTIFLKFPKHFNFI
ncbi:MFS transporter [Staphylococcus saprophyticus]|uniref:MFS transporter n=1 Tax=Staphylococcus saprophyticus TaxID=29385 RepID=UPI0024C28085|nr:MFS transporter [Staphylococcus saprophyticus]MDK1672850.1 MFS transporter [Staphylococcus saprophyticus]